MDPGTHLGGLTTGGLGWTDIGNKQVIGGIALEFYKNVKRQYDDPKAWPQEKRAEYFKRRQSADCDWNIRSRHRRRGHDQRR